MKKEPIYITKLFINDLWNIKGDIEQPLDLNIQMLRWIVYTFEINDRDKLKKTVSINEAYKNAFSYFDIKGKRKYLISNKTKFIELISNSTPFWQYDKVNELIHFNFDYDYYYINFESKYKWLKEKHTTEYIVAPCRKISNEEWNWMKQTSINELKIYFFILSEKMRGKYNFIKISIDELRRRLLIKNKSNKQLKLALKKILNSLKTKGIINDFEINAKYEIKIQKYEIKPKKILN